MKPSSFHRKRYGQWAGHPQGNVADPERCAESVTPNERGPIPHQCRRKRGFGPEQAFCKQHDPAAKRERDRKVHEEWVERQHKRAIELSGQRFLDALIKIAKGANDARAIAQAAVKEFIE